MTNFSGKNSSDSCERNFNESLFWIRRSKRIPSMSLDRDFYVCWEIDLLRERIFLSRTMISTIEFLKILLDCYYRVCVCVSRTFVYLQLRKTIPQDVHTALSSIIPCYLLMLALFDLAKLFNCLHFIFWYNFRNDDIYTRHTLIISYPPTK